MSGKSGTLLGRFVAKALPSDSPLHDIAESVDKTIESLLFDEKTQESTPVERSSDFIHLIQTAKPLILHLVHAGLITVNFPMVDGDNEKSVEAGLEQVFTGYINEVLD